MQQDELNREISQGKALAKQAKLYNKTVEEMKLPPVVDFDCLNLQHLLWDDLITCHQNQSRAYTWSVLNHRRGHQLDATEAPTPSPIKVSCIFVLFDSDNSALPLARVEILVLLVQPLDGSRDIACKLVSIEALIASLWLKKWKWNHTWIQTSVCDFRDFFLQKSTTCPRRNEEWRTNRLTQLLFKDSWSMHSM